MTVCLESRGELLGVIEGAVNSLRKFIQCLETWQRGDTNVRIKRLNWIDVLKLLICSTLFPKGDENV